MKREFKLLLPSVLCTALAACVSAPTTGHTASSPHPPAVAKPAAAAPSTGSVPGPAAAPAQAAPADDWASLRGSFAMMNDCDGDPAILSWAHRYTRSPRRFEAQMREVLPRLAYVQQVADKHGVPGEFVLLPWVESQFRPLLARRDRPAGMWQITADTANSMGLKVDGKFDGRLDVPSAADAVMELLSRYHDELHDWRLVNYAYNAGEFSVRKLVDEHGTPPEQPLIPRLPVKSVTREHLVRLLAISCVIHDPARFSVSLPQLSSDKQLVSVPLPRSIPLATAADRAGMSTNDLYGLNAGFRDGMAGKAAAPHLLLPRAHAEQLQDALQQNPIGEPTPDALSASQAVVQSAPDTPVKPSSIAASRSGKNARQKIARAKSRTNKTSADGRTHRVGKGESLWTIAHRYKIDVGELKRLNHLSDASSIKPGQVILVSS